MKTSGFRCETKFGLLVFLGHPNTPPLLFTGSSIISRGQRMHYKYSGHQRRVIQTFGVGNNIQRTYTGYPERERSAKRANTLQHMSAELNTSNTHSYNVKKGYD